MSVDACAAVYLLAAVLVNDLKRLFGELDEVSGLYSSVDRRPTRVFSALDLLRFIAGAGVLGHAASCWCQIEAAVAR